MAIHGVKIYGANGELKQELTAEQVSDLYNEKQKKVFTLSPNERRMWNMYIEGATFKDEEVKPKSKIRRVVSEAGKEKMRQSKKDPKTGQFTKKVPKWVNKLSPEMAEMVKGWSNGNENKTDQKENVGNL